MGSVIKISSHLSERAARKGCSTPSFKEIEERMKKIALTIKKIDEVMIELRALENKSKKE